MLSVQHHGDHFVPPKPQKDLEMIAVSRFDFRSLDVRRVINGMFIVIFEHAQQILKFRSRNENHAAPVMNHAARTSDGLTVIEDFQLLHLYFAAFERRVGRCPSIRWEPIHPQQVSAALQFTFISCFRQFHVALKRCLSFRFQFWDRGFPGLHDLRRHRDQAQHHKDQFRSNAAYGFHLSRESFKPRQHKSSQAIHSTKTHGNMRIHGASRMQVAYRRTQKKGGPGCQALLPCALV